MTISTVKRGAKATAGKAMAAMLMATTALGASAIVATPAAAQAARSYDIPAGELADVLNQFSRQAGVELAYNAELTAGLSSPGLKGSYAPAEGLSRILTGTGITFRQTGPRGFTLERAPQSADGAIQLGPVRVEGNGSGVGYAGIAPSITSDPNSTEGTGSYTIARMRSATKLDLSIRETPQTVTVITRQRIDDQNMNTLNDALLNAPGVTVYFQGPERPAYIARGFEVDNTMFDGVPTTTTYNERDALAAADLAIYDRVEIVRGATGLMQGAGNPSAAINLVRKMPTEDTQIHLAGSTGNWNRYRAELDVSAPLTSNGALRGRFVAAYQNHQSFQDYTQKERILFYGAIAAKLGDMTDLSFGLSRQIDNNDAAWGSIPVGPDGSDLHLPRSTYLGNNWDYWNQRNTTAFAKLEHDFGGGWKATVSANRVWGKMDFLATKLNYLNGQYNQRGGDYLYKINQSGIDIFVDGIISILGRDHEIVIGGNIRNDKMDNTGGGFTSFTGMNVYNWDFSMVERPRNYAKAFYNLIDQDQKGAYATVRINPADRIKIILGGRLDWFDYDSKYIYGDSYYKVNSHITKYAGLIFDVSPHYSIYGSYTDIFKPQSNVGLDGKVITPILGKNYEIGLKGEYFDGALVATLAIFRADQANRAAIFPDQSLCPGYADGVSCYEAAGLVRSKGVDIEVQGSVTPNWQIGGGYTYISDKYVRDADATKIGETFDTDNPHHQFKLSTTYRFIGALSAWRLGGNVRWQSNIYNKGPGWRVKQGAYAVLDLSLGFRPTNHIDLQLNANNLFDKRYYQGITAVVTQGNSVYGAPRNVMLTGRYTF